MKVDPENRLVADALEAEWNEASRRHAEAAEDGERRRQEQVTSLDAETQRRLRRRGMLSTREVAARFAVSEAAVHDWERKGLIKKCIQEIYWTKSLRDRNRRLVVF